MNCENEKYMHRRLSGSNSELRRTRSVRASFRLLGSRWKPNRNNSCSNNTDSTLSVTTSNKDYQHVDAIKKFSEKVKNHLNDNNNNAAGKIKTNRKLFQAFSKENVIIRSDMTDTLFLPPKTTAAILQIPGTGEDFNRNTCKFLLSSPNLRILKRSESMKSTAAAAGPKTATIRRGSVWANSTSSNFFFFLFLFCF